MLDYNDEEMEDVAGDLHEQLKNDEIVELITELYFLLETPDRVIVKKNIS